MQQELTTPCDLLNDTGELNARGWARHPVARYNRERIAAPWYRIKEWDYYCVLTPGYGIALTISDVGYLADITVSWLDLAARTEVTETVMKPLSRGSLNLPRSVDEGDVAYKDKRIDVRFTRNPASRVLSIDFPGFDHGRGIRGSLRLDQDPGQERMVILTPFANAPKAFYYNQKVNCMPATGIITVGGVDHAFRSDTASGVLDWGRGVWPYRNMWYWGSGSGHVDGHSFGFNIGYGFGDTSAASENVLFWDGHIHKLDCVEFQIPPESFLKPWKVVSNDHRFDMDFEPTLDRHSRTDVGILKTIQHQVFGTFTGTAVLDDGTPVHLDRFPGFAEKVLNQW
ncbi:MAG TPA: DUF2804 domain-containing protein [Candidatus Cryosericum sp.]|nr:DUF2804 domain-containing protein [Candidatus Cryosericum sp.]